MAHDWIDVRIESSVDSGELLGILSDPAATGAWQENGVIHLYWPADRWNPDALQDLKQVLRELGNESDRPAITVDMLPERDCNALWARSVKPLKIGRRIIVRPSWEHVELQPGEIELIIDPTQAFGTGHHAAAQLLIEWLEELIRGGEQVLDVCTGSGILAMVALRLGAKAVIGIDHDPVAIGCARKYAAANGLGPALELRIATLRDLQATENERFDIVLANLDRQTILDSIHEFAPYLNLGARLLLSGMLTESRADISDAFLEVGGVVRASRERDGWLALEVIVPEPCEGSS
ncbi:MAG: 50S ribosomal protein L11 methyltransferase [Nitrospirae bacterium]|nr:50S ribosomal protein L11 methyltransferase [Nitrospirota bacterium]